MTRGAGATPALCSFEKECTEGGRRRLDFTGVRCRYTGERAAGKAASPRTRQPAPCGAGCLEGRCYGMRCCLASRLRLACAMAPLVPSFSPSTNASETSCLTKRIAASRSSLRSSARSCGSKALIGLYVTIGVRERAYPLMSTKPLPALPVALLTHRRSPRGCQVQASRSQKQPRHQKKVPGFPLRVGG